MVGEPFFPRRPDGSILWDKSEEDWDPDGMSMLVRCTCYAGLCSIMHGFLAVRCVEACGRTGMG